MRFTTSRFRNSRPRTTSRNRLKYDERRIVPSAPNYNGTMTRRRPPASMIPYMPMPRRPRVPQSYRIRNNSSVVKSINSGGSTFSSYIQGRNRMSRALYTLFKNNQDWIITSSTSRRVDSNLYGKQGIAQYSTAPVFTDDIFRALGGTTPNAQVRATSTLYYGSVDLKTTFTNQELTTTYLSIYDIQPRFNISGVGNRPIELWELGLAYQQSVATPQLYAYEVYQKPFTSELFTKFYKVLNVQRIEMAPGATHCHRFKYYINRGILGYLDSTFEYLHHSSRFQMYVASGTPINDSVVLGNVSTSTIAIDVVNHITYNYTYSAQLRTRSVVFNAFPTVTAANVITDTTVIPDNEA